MMYDMMKNIFLGIHQIGINEYIFVYYTMYDMMKNIFIGIQNGTRALDCLAMRVPNWIATYTTYICVLYDV